MNAGRKKNAWKPLLTALAAVAAIGMIWYAILLSAGTAPAVPPPVIGAEPGDAQGTGTGAAQSSAQAADPSTAQSTDPGAAQSGSQTAPNAGGPDSPAAFDLSDVPPYSDSPNVEINGNVPFFAEEDFTTSSFETYGELDALGRCTAAFACVGADLMPTGKREPISQVRPTGWSYAKYDGIDGNYLYNRCHLIAYGLTAENANERNLITGTRYMNTAGMNALENETIGYIRRTGNHVLYRVTPVFEGNNLVASGVLMEAQSVEKRDFRFCVYAYNVQPGITIDYATGESSGTPFAGTPDPHPQPARSAPSWEFVPPAEDVTYILNTNSMKFHLPGCDAVREMNPKNREDFKGTREDAVEMGYAPCGSCKP